MNPYNNQFYQRTYDIHPEGYNQQNEYLNSNEEEENEFEENFSFIFVICYNINFFSEFEYIKHCFHFLYFIFDFTLM